MAYGTWYTAHSPFRHCEERSDEAISYGYQAEKEEIASLTLAMTELYVRMLV